MQVYSPRLIRILLGGRNGGDRGQVHARIRPGCPNGVANGGGVGDVEPIGEQLSAWKGAANGGEQMPTNKPASARDQNAARLPRRHTQDAMRVR